MRRWCSCVLASRELINPARDLHRPNMRHGVVRREKESSRGLGSARSHSVMPQLCFCVLHTKGHYTPSFTYSSSSECLACPAVRSTISRSRTKAWYPSSNYRSHDNLHTVPQVRFRLDDRSPLGAQIRDSSNSIRDANTLTSQCIMAEFRLAHTSLQTELVGTSLPHTPTVVSYNGLQYATVKQRWTRAALRTNYGSTYDARHFGPKCPQPEHLNNTSDYGPDIPFPECEIDEFDCLNLNVTTSRKTTEPCPVLFWIHGGSLLNGANSDSIWDANRLAQWAVDAGKPIVIVSVNYRLGPFGFFQPPARYALSNEMAKGNFGLHDQLLALQWVRAHIAGFGGNPERVTIGGESAGGCSVHAQIAYQEMTRGKRLFNRAIMQSGNLGVMGVLNASRLHELWIGAVADAGLSTSADPVQVLRTMAPRTLGTLPTLDISGYGVFSDDIFVSEPIFGLDGRFLSQAPSLAAVMHGDNADEGNIFREAAGETSAMLALEDIGECVLGRERLATLLNLYGLSDWQSLDESQRRERLCRFPEDARFYLPTDELQLAWPCSALYHFMAKSPFTTSAFPGDSFHTLELLHLFGNFDYFLKEQGNDQHLKLGEEMRKTWTDFIYAEEPWARAYEGVAAVFSDNGKNTVPVNEARGWDADRSSRIRALQGIGYAEIVELATRVFP